MKPCVINGCIRRAHRRGWCSRHYDRWRAHGDPLGGRPTFTGEVLDWLHRNYSPPADDSCVLWPFAKTGKGYGHLVIDGKDQHAHRYALTLREGPAPLGKPFAIHGPCHNPLCVVHCRWGTAHENSADMIRDGTVLRGWRNSNTVLTEGDVRKVRSLRSEGESQQAIADMFGVGQNAIHKILAGKTWAWLDDEEDAA